MIAPIDASLRGQVNKLVADEWAGPYIVSRGVISDASKTDGFAAVENGVLQGFALYKITGESCELLVLQSVVENRGVGSALISAVADAARARSCKELWLITTNDNTRAIRFYQRFGFELRAAHIGAVDEARRLKPSIPLTGCDGIPIRHELEFVYYL